MKKPQKFQELSSHQIENGSLNKNFRKSSFNSCKQIVKMRGHLNKAFTLIELLAVIVILAIIAVITVPIITGIIDNVKKQAFTRSVESSLKAFELLRSNSQDSVSRIDVTDDRLPLEHNKFLTGTIMTVNKGEMEAYYLYDGTYCGSGTLGNITVKKGPCEESFDEVGNFIMKNYILTIDSNGGTWKNNGSLQNINILMNEVNDLENPIRAGYSFTGWDMSVTGELENEDNGFLRTTLKAKWDANTYKLLINPNGGKYDNSTSIKLVDVESDKYSELLIPERDSYTFGGWEVSGEGSQVIGNQFKMGSEDSIITAIWTANTYTVHYDCNGGDGSTTSSTHTYGVSSNLSVNGCYKIVGGSSGKIYYMSGWSIDKNAITPEYTKEQSLLISDSMTLYAVWQNLFSYNQSYFVENDGDGNWRIKFYNSGTLNLFTTDYTYDVFLVGGGGGGGLGWGDGGGGGYTMTVKNLILPLNTDIPVIIGLGGSGAPWGHDNPGYTGGTSSFYNSSTIYALGGIGGGSSCCGGDFLANSGSGGSGGGVGGGTGGSDGGNGAGANGTYRMGQGTTTREFGESTGDIYAGGGAGEHSTGGAGGGGGTNGSTGLNGKANTGGGGGGGGTSEDTAGWGGSGIVVLRNAR